MNIRQKILNAILYISTGFTIGHGLLAIIIITNRNLYSTISFHYSDNITWYVFIFGLPIIAGLAFYFWIKNRNVLKGVKILFGAVFIIQISFTIISTTKNSNYWGYAFKRPTVFNELSSAETILESSRVSNYDSTGIQSLYVVLDKTDIFGYEVGREDPYYGNIDRPFMVFQDNSHINADLYDFLQVFGDTNKNILHNELLCIDNQIQNSRLIDKGEQKNHYDYLGQLNGIVTKFKTTDNKIYIFAGFDGREISNDHYPFYEFLFIKDGDNYKLIKKQKYYTDVAGIEGLEYANIAPIFSLLLSIIGVISLAIILLTNRIIKSINGKKHNDL